MRAGMLHEHVWSQMHKTFVTMQSALWPLLRSWTLGAMGWLETSALWTVCKSSTSYEQMPTTSQAPYPPWHFGELR